MKVTPRNSLSVHVVDIFPRFVLFCMLLCELNKNTIFVHLKETTADDMGNCSIHEIGVQFKINLGNFQLKNDVHSKLTQRNLLWKSMYWYFHSVMIFP